MRLARILVLIAILTFSCASSPRYDDPQVQAQNYPLRTLSVIVYSDNSDQKDEIYGFIRSVSNILEYQVGIKLKVAAFNPIKIPEKVLIQHPDGKLEYVKSYTQCGSLALLERKTLSSYSEKSFDISILFMKRPSAESWGQLMVWNGVIDGSARRYIVMKVLDEYSLVHEIGHAFIFSHVHSSEGVMKESLWGFGTSWFNEEDRVEILRNKKRDFSEAPRVRASNIKPSDFIPK